MAHLLQFYFGKLAHDVREIHPNVKRLLLALFFFHVGWGFIEPYFSIYLQNTLQSYTLIGIVQGITFFISLILAVPLGHVADKVNNIKSIKQLMALYTPSSVLYFLAGAGTSLLAAPFIFIAQVNRGFAIGYRVFVDAYIRKHAQAKHTAGVFGLLFTAQFTGYAIGTGIGLMAIIVWSVTAGTLYWLVIPLIAATWMAIFILNTIPENQGLDLKTEFRHAIHREELKKEMGEFKQLGFSGSLMILALFLFAMIHTFIWIYLPLYALQLKLNLIEIGILFVFISAAYATSFGFAEMADGIGKKRSVVLTFLMAALIIAGMSMLQTAGTTFLLLGLGLSVTVAWAGPSLYGIITDLSASGHEGQFTGIMNSITKVSEFISAIVLGIALDLAGFAFTLQGIAVILAIYGVLFFLAQNAIRVKARI